MPPAVAPAHVSMLALSLWTRSMQHLTRYRPSQQSRTWPPCPILTLIIAMALCAPLSSALAWSSEVDEILTQGRSILSMEIDNDTLLLRRNDGLYTSGLRFSQSYRQPKGDQWRMLGWRFGQQIFTPRYVARTPQQLEPLDRPYAGWLYAGLQYLEQESDGSERAFGIDVGCLGPCAGGHDVQSGFHRLLNQPQPRGWSTQLSNEWGLVLHAGARGRPRTVSPWMDWRPSVALRVGNIFTDIVADASLRGGLTGSDGIRMGRFGFVRGGVRWVGYDATLQGGLFDQDSQRTVRPTRLIPEWEIGFNWQQSAWSWRVSVLGRENEIEGVSAHQGRQAFLRLVLTYAP